MFYNLLINYPLMIYSATLIILLLGNVNNHDHLWRSGRESSRDAKNRKNGRERIWQVGAFGGKGHFLRKRVCM